MIFSYFITQKKKFRPFASELSEISHEVEFAPSFPCIDVSTASSYLKKLNGYLTKSPKYTLFSTHKRLSRDLF